RGSVADWLDVDDNAVAAVEALLGDHIEYIVVDSEAQAEAGLRAADARAAGRVGFLVLGDMSLAGGEQPAPAADLRLLADVVRGNASGGDAVVRALGAAWIAPSLAVALDASARTSAPVATWRGEVCRNGRLIQGGARQESRGILETKREIRELRERVAEAGAQVERLRTELAALDTRIAEADASVLSLGSEQHRQEKSIVSLELQVAGGAEAIDR